MLIGIVLTVLMQSSSASLTIALTAAQGGLLTAQGAAAVVIGANVGTTATALIASIGATLTGESKAGAAKNVPKRNGDGIAAWLAFLWERIAVVGKPLMLGLAILACTLGLLVYLTITLLWRLKTGLAWRQRHRKTALHHLNVTQQVEPVQAENIQGK